MRQFPFVLLASFLSATLPAGALAQTCFTLQAELQHLRSQGGGGAPDTSRYERAFREQVTVIGRTEARARSAGCFGGGFLFFQRQPSQACRVLVPKLREMQANLGRLDQMRRRGGGGASRRVREIQGMMAARGCAAAGGGWYDGREQNERAEPRFSGGTFRTLCVRTCDGYYFPISYATSQDQFVEDARTCSSMCPGAQAELFYHRNPGGGPEEMTSIVGQLYSSLPTAFQYRTSFNPSCSCKPAGDMSVAAADPDAATVLDRSLAEQPPTLLPKPRPDPGEDPETLANRAGGLVLGADAPGVMAAGAALSPDGQPIRIVGPIFGASPEQEGLVVTPVPN